VKHVLVRLTAVALVAASCVTLTVTLGTAAASTSSTKVARVPNVTHMRLDTAQSRLQLTGLRTKAHGGGFFGIVVKHNWEVCFQNPRAGKRVAPHSRVNLYVSRPGEC